MKSINLICLALLLFSSDLLATYKTETLVLDKTRLHVTDWSASEIDGDTHPNITNKETVILLSGPTDNWNSDSAWFARLAPKLSKRFNVVSIDRAGQVFADRDSNLGYAKFGEHLVEALLALNLKQVRFISFASSNISLLKFSEINMRLPKASQIKVKKIIMIDPDVLMPYSISRYSNDAKPFKDNLAAYTKYILEGKYNHRAAEKNQAELEHLKDLSKDDKDTSWSYVELMFSKRLKKENIVNLFEEIAMYAEDLRAVDKITFPNDIPVVIFDTDFEKSYIENAKTEQDKTDLTRWKIEAKEYYQALANGSKKGKYIELDTTEHLLPFSNPERIIQSL